MRLSSVRGQHEPGRRPCLPWARRALHQRLSRPSVMVGREVMRNDTVRHRKGARVTSPGAWNRCVMLILTMLVSCEAVFGSPGRLAGGIGAAKPKVIDNIANEDLPRGRNLEECDAGESARIATHPLAL